MLTRRAILQGAAGLALGGAGLGSYAFAIEPGFMLNLTRYRVQPQNWPAGLQLKIAVIADIHACEPHMGLARIAKIAAMTNALQPDLICLLGDFNGGHRFVTRVIWPAEWAEALSVLKAPLGVHAILGNHDWWHGPIPGMKGDGAARIRAALKYMGARLHENDAVRLEKDGHAFWLVGVGDQLAEKIGYRSYRGHDDLDGALARVSDDAPIVLMAHEPYIFHRVPERVALTLCGHTHGGQVNVPFLGPVQANKRFGSDRVYGWHTEAGRHLVISAGLGESIMPVRFMRPPEIVEIVVGAPVVAA